MFPYPLVWPSLEEELAPFLKYCQGIVLNAGSGTRGIKLGDRDFGIDIVPENNPDIIGDLHRIPLLDESVDTVVNIAVLEHTRYAWIVAQEFYRVLRPGGYGVICVPFLQPQHASPYDFVRFTNRGLRELMEYVGFEVVETSNVHHFGQTIAWLLWEYLQHNVPDQSSWSFWGTLIKEMSLGHIFGGDSPNTHNAEYVIVSKSGDSSIKQPYYLEALTKNESEKWYLPLLSCPKTRQPLHFQGDRLISADGQHHYSFQDGKPYLLPTEGEFKLKITEDNHNLQVVAPPPESVASSHNQSEQPDHQNLNNHQNKLELRKNPLTSDKNFTLNFKSQITKLFPQTNPPKIAVLVTSEYEGIFKNGGVGTYYKNLATRLDKQGWYVILIAADFESNYQGESPLSEVKHIFSNNQLKSSVNLQSIHTSILDLDLVQNNWFDYLSFSCLFFLQAIENHFRNSKIYVEFHEMSGFGYRSLEAKQSKILGNNCLIAVTLHSGHEWVYEANEKYIVEYPPLVWQASAFEQFSFENADLAFFPSHFLASKVKSYGWETKSGINMPNYIPQFQVNTNLKKADLSES